MKIPYRNLAAALGFGALAVSVHGAELIVSQDPRDPAEEARAFHVPPGFEVQLVAAEPQIHKPINIAFDDKGRLWVTDTVEYPFPVAEGKPSRDTVKVLSDFAPDGHARSITTFADNLNIPIGVLPQRGADGHDSAIVYSIPGVWRFTDARDAGKADQRKLLISGQAHDDTHGMTGSFLESFDGYIYAVHGFRNESTLHGADGSSISMTSGHTYRFASDGSRLQVNTSGQVNPFGMCLDPLGDLFTSDCETMPILMTLRGAYYSSFGRPHDGLGFGPDMSDHMYGSTAIAGLLDYVAPNFPPAFQNMMLVGNVVTNRINRAQLVPRGSAFHADDAPDFLTSDDHWFRPTCMKLGPDGAIYVADFYNRIIGHYEVDLHHPGRDKERGRIWRIVYKGPDAPATLSTMPDLTRASNEQLLKDLSDSNFALRMLAMNYIADCKPQLSAQVKSAMSAPDASPEFKAHGVWILKRTGALDDALLAALAADASPLVRVHAMRVLSETSNWNERQRQLSVAGLRDADAVVQRCAADALGQHAQIQNVRPLLDAREKAPAADTHLVHTLRMALRNQLNDQAVAEQLPLPGSSDDDVRALLDAAQGANSAGSTMLVVRQIGAGPADAQKLVDAFRHVGRFGTDANAEELTKTAREKFAQDDSLQLALFAALAEGITQRNGMMSDTTRQWGQALAMHGLAEPEESFGGWTSASLAGAAADKETWAVQDRKSADGVTAPFISSLPLGETNTGVIRSRAFAVPPALSFYIAGHNGLPSEQSSGKNVIRLRAADTNQMLVEAFPPRNDTAMKVTWDLGPFAGRSAYIEVTDGDDRTAYAWLAFGRFDPPVISVPAAAERHRIEAAVSIAAMLHLAQARPRVAAILSNKKASTESRIAAAKALPALGSEASSDSRAMTAVLADPATPGLLREAIGGALQQDASPEVSAAMVEAIRTAPNKLQLSLARDIASTPGGADALLSAVAAGKASPRLLQDANVSERLKLSHLPDLDARIAKLTANLPPADLAIQAAIDARVKAFDRSRASAERGQKVFQQNCAVCHSVGGVGAHVGPQLDGIGIRGPARLVEDVLDPSRNVDAAFRYNSYQLDTGEVIAGIPRREEGDLITVADSTGKEVAISRSKVKRIVPSTLSLMPSNFSEAIKPQDFDDLLAYLLSTAR